MSLSHSGVRLLTEYALYVRLRGKRDTGRTQRLTDEQVDRYDGFPDSFLT